MKIEVALCPYK